MRKFGKWVGRILLALILAAAVIGLWKREEIMRLLAVNSLFSEDKIVNNFSHMDAAFLSTPIARGTGPISALPLGTPMPLSSDVSTWIKARNVTSLLVLKDGDVVFEDYYLGTSKTDRRISWSLAKSFLSALFGVLIDEGKIDSLDDPVVKYAPLLKGSAYETASIRNVLNMASGVTFDEDYLDYDSDINRMGRALALGGTLDDFTASFKDSFASPGNTWQYVSIDTHVIGMVIRGATGRSIPDLLTEKIIAPLGFEKDGYYLTDGAGVAFVLGGINLTTRDYARFALMILQNGEYGGAQIVPVDWIAASTSPSAPTAEGRIGYGYQWWIPVGSHAGEFLGQGVYGQYIYIDQAAGVVIVTTGANRHFRDKGTSIGNIAIFRQITAGLQ